MSGVQILAALRTPVAPRGGALSRLDLPELCAPVIGAALEAAGMARDAVDEVILGNALGAGGNPARRIALAAGLGERVAGLTLDRQCVSGLDALVMGAALIRAEQAEVVVAGGVESYSRRPLRWRTDPDGGPPVAYDRPPFTPWPDRDPEMDDAAADLVRELGLTREEMDGWAVESHRRARMAEARLRSEILPLGGLAQDAFTRDLTPRIAARAPVLVGPVTAANAAVAADGAAVCVMVSDRVARQLGRPGPRFVAGITLGGRPEMPGLAPVEAIRDLLAQTETRVSDLAVIEVMEAYAVQAMACVRLAGLDPARVNPGGGGLARGHPIGASGAVNAVRLWHELRSVGGLGLAAIAAAGGIGTAVLLSTAP
ncbi:thiolase family protein [Maritimibacter sp. DP1N21-5]|uniref:thiolase family protein n=1 Tax=Maritimibacter sp. DP1N21-5 TaxID=2836867 RepID=UPI001C44F90F|nr:thiolase family protein [Maritimibacter sp. DP1N21-5]MBV7407795.1 thiolase family protein [Maritimibacter sp. DP1N21-5]